MKCLTVQQANAYLGCVGMQVDNWNRITDTSSDEWNKRKWTNYQAPKGALELYNFSQYIAGWLPRGDWKIFQIDNSNSLNEAESALFGRLLFGSENILDINRPEYSTFLFNFGNDERVNQNTELLIANLIYVFLLFDCHGFVVSSGSHPSGQLLGVQDGFAYFYSKEVEISGAKSLLKNFESNPLMSPQWILDR